MSAEGNKGLVRSFYEDVVNTGDVRRMADFVAPDCVETDGKVRLVSGVEGMAEHVRAVREVYQGLTLTVEGQIAEGDWVVTCVTARGLHVGSWLGMRPTGKPLTFYGVNVDRVRDGKIVEHGGAANLLEPLLEAGALKVVPA